VDKIRVTRLTFEDPSQLLANPFNPKIHPAEQQAILRAALKQIGWIGAVIQNDTTGYLIDGHDRVANAISTGQTQVPVLHVDLEEDEEAFALATYDPIGYLAVKDQQLTDQLLDGMVTGDPVLDDFLASLKSVVLPETNEDTADLTPPTEPITKPGDIWILGGHRLMCGDSTNPEDVAKLLNGERPVLLATDPPYGVNYDSTWRAPYSSGNYTVGTITGDSEADWSAAWPIWEPDVIYLWHGGLHADIAKQGLQAQGYEVRSQIIWDKTVPVFGRGNYHWEHEPAWYAVRKGATATWQGDRKQTTIWRVPNNSGAARTHDPVDTNADLGHVSQKPVELFRRPILNNTLAGQVVADPFGGTGPMIIAAEQLGRRAMIMELEPAFCDVIVRRWEQVSGQEAVRG